MRKKAVKQAAEAGTAKVKAKGGRKPMTPEEKETAAKARVLEKEKSRRPSGLRKTR